MGSVHDDIAVGVFVAGGDGAFVSVNSRLARMLGVEREDALGRPWFDFVERRSRERAKSDWKSGEGLALGFVRADGTILDARLDVRASGDVWIGTVVDISAQRDALYRLFMQAPASIAIVRGPEFVYELSNDMNQRLLGGRQVLGKSVREAFPELADQGLFAMLQHVYETGEPFVTDEIEAKVLGEDGKTRQAFLAGTYTPLRDADGRIDGVLAFAYEVTELVAARRRQEFLAKAGRVLAPSLDYMTTLHRAAELAVPELADWCFVDVVEDGSARRVAAAHAPDVAEDVASDAETVVVPLVARGKTHGTVTLARRKGGAAYREDDKAVAEDLAARVATQIENAQLYAAAESANRAKDEFLATVSHELRTPLSSILGWASLLRSETHDAASVAKALEVIERNARSQMRLIEDILDFSRVVRGEMRLSRKGVDVAQLAREVIETVAPSATAKEIALEANGVDTACKLVGDPDRLRQVLWNLLANAVKFTPADGRVELSVRRAVENNAGVVEIVVRDTGRGMEPSFVPHAFEPFRQGDARASATSAGGVGLGLAIVKHIVEAHGGHVRAESDGIGHGSSFRVALPIAPVSRRPDETGRHPAFRDPASRARRLERVRVLVVEDDPDGRELVELTLAREGANVRTAATAHAALTELRAEPFDVVLSDIGLPEHDGYWLAREIRRERPDQTLVALTAFGRPEDVTRALDAGFAAHLTKPVEPSDLIEAITRSMARE